MYIYGGFELSSPTLPTDSIFKINLAQLFKNNPNLHGKIVDLNSSISSVSSNNSVVSSSTRTGTGRSDVSRVNEIGRETLVKADK